jgi:hypothetical protein
MVGCCNHDNESSVSVNGLGGGDLTSYRNISFSDSFPQDGVYAQTSTCVYSRRIKITWIKFLPFR